MNMEQYLKLQATNDNYSDELSVLPLGSVKKPLDTQVVGQARINGHKQQHIAELVADTGRLQVEEIDGRRVRMAKTRWERNQE